MKSMYINAVQGEMYENRNGKMYLCLVGSDDKTPGLFTKATFERQSDGWMLVAHGIIQYEDGTIEWNFSTDGYWPGGHPKNM